MSKNTKQPAAVRKAIAMLERRRKAVASERDKLRDLLSEVEELGDHAEEACDDLQSAIDALSRLQ